MEQKTSGTSPRQKTSGTFPRGHETLAKSGATCPGFTEMPDFDGLRK